MRQTPPEVPIFGMGHPAGLLNSVCIICPSAPRPTRRRACGNGAGRASAPVGSRVEAWLQTLQAARFIWLQGLRERNWTSKYYNPQAEKWSLQFFEDRCVVPPALVTGVCGHLLLSPTRANHTSTIPPSTPLQRPLHAPVV